MSQPPPTLTRDELADITGYKEARNGIERHPGNTAHENAAWEWGRKDGGWDGKH